MEEKFGGLTDIVLISLFIVSSRLVSSVSLIRVGKKTAKNADQTQDIRLDLQLLWLAVILHSVRLNVSSF